MDKLLIEKLASIVGQDFIIDDKDDIKAYLFDEVELEYRPKACYDVVVVKPSSTQQISEIMKLSNDEEIPVVVRGGATGLCGGCTPVKPSIIISMERLKKIIEIDEKNMVAVLEAGVTLMELLDALKEYNDLSFPVHPGDEGAQMGGMAVTNAAGARAVRHGPMRKHIQGMTVVLNDGTILKLGGKLVKNNAGYNIMQLIMGSEGSLAVVSEVVLKLYPREDYTATLVCPFPTVEGACEAVMDVLRSGTIPLAVEYMDKRLFVDTAKMLGLDWQAKDGAADLLIILSERTKPRLMEAVKVIDKICRKYTKLPLLYGEKEREQEELLLVRSAHYDLIKDEICDSFDMAVAVGSVPDFIRDLKKIANDYSTYTNVIAHIADGNVHNDIPLVDGKVPEYAKEMKEKMYECCFSYGGTITGEHGIGKIRIEDLGQQKSEREIRLMKDLKKVFDPKNLINPDTVVSI